MHTAAQPAKGARPHWALRQGGQKGVAENRSAQAKRRPSRVQEAALHLQLEQGAPHPTCCRRSPPVLLAVGSAGPVSRR